MNAQSLLGFALLVIGVSLVAAGYNTSYSFAEQISSVLMGHAQPAAWYLLGGCAATFAGVILALFGGGRGSHA